MIIISVYISVINNNLHFSYIIGNLRNKKEKKGRFIMNR